MWLCKVAELCEAANAKVGYDSVRIANYLCNGNYAISGGTDGCQAVQDLAKPKGARMTVKLAVAGAFHTSYMQPAQEELEYAPMPCWFHPHFFSCAFLPTFLYCPTFQQREGSS